MAFLKQTLLKLEEVAAVKFGDFTLKNGQRSPIYFDLRVIVSHPKLMEDVAELLWKAKDPQVNSDLLCGVPYTALPLATVIAIKEGIPMVIRRKEAKDYGTKKLLEGQFIDGDNCLIIEDVVTSGSSVLETAKVLQDHGLKVTDAVVLLNREQGGTQALKENGINLRSVCGISQLMKVLVEHGRISQAVAEDVNKFIDNNQVVHKKAAGNLKQITLYSYAERLKLMLGRKPMSKRVLETVQLKKSNLCVAADVSTCAELLQLAKQLGPHIACLKLHVDAVEDWNPGFAQGRHELRDIADNEDFLLMEDRKFSDIGNTVRMQFSRIREWIDLVTVHGVSGPGVIEGIFEASRCGGRLHGALIVAQMSCSGNLISPDYTTACVKMAERFEDELSIGFISQSRLSQNAELIQVTPGVHLSAEKDDLSQKYISPEEAILNRGADLIIVGRGITKAKDPVKAALEYKTEAWKAYEARVAN